MRKPAREDELVNEQIEESDSDDADQKSRQKKGKNQKLWWWAHYRGTITTIQAYVGMYLLWDLRHGFRREEYCVCSS